MSKGSHKVQEVAPEEIIEVAAFEEADAMLKDFMEQNSKTMDILKQLIEKRNEALAAADAKIRVMATDKNIGLSSGPFRFKTFQHRINVDRALDILGPDLLLACGGSKKTVVQYSIGTEQTEMAIAQGKITKEQADMFLTKSPVFNKPDKINIWE